MDKQQALFETKEARFRGVYRVFASTIMVGICLIWFYRFNNFPRVEDLDHQPAAGRWAWIGMFMAEIGFGLYWIITQSVRWNLTRFHPFKDRLSNRYENKLPGIDIFVCTADPKMEPPTLVINTVLSAMSYNYPSEKLSVYVSDDGGSEFTFYALLEAYLFSKHWIPFCKKLNVEPRAPEAYFAQQSSLQHRRFSQEWLAIKKLYEKMKTRIEAAIEVGKIPEEMKKQHKGFSEWNFNIKKNDHQSIVQILIDGRDHTSAVDNEGSHLPTLVYMAREKRPNWPHNFKAGAMNALIRVSSEITNAPFILNLDCDMYSNNADTIREILCFFMDEKKGDEVAFVQFPQNYNNMTKNDIYGNACYATNAVELAGAGGYGAALYCGTGCIHRRESLCGEKYSKGERVQWNIEGKKNERSVTELEESSKVLACCGYEKGTQWGKEMGLMYGCPVEDIVTGLTIQCRGWKSVYYNPERRAFLGVAPTTLEVGLVQHKRWSEGMSQIFLSKYCPFTYGRGRIKLGAQMAYSIYLLWAPFSLPVLYYVVVPSLCLFKGVALFPEVSSPWFLPFASVFIAKNVFSALEAINCGSTLKGWWNLQRMWLIRRTTSYFIALLDIIKGKLGLSETTFTLTDKVVTEDVSKRYEQEIMEFGSSSIMFTMLATLALLNLFTLVGGIMKILMDLDNFKAFEQLILQIVLCVIIVLINLPVYQALFVRSDNGCIPSSVMFKSIVLASVLCLMPIY